MQKYVKIVLFFAIVLGIFCLFALPFPSMGLDSDFFGVLWDVRATDSWISFWKSSLAQTYYPVNEQQQATTFLSFYRPIVQHLHALENYFFENWWLGYFFVAMGFFSCIAGILFLLFSYAYPLVDAVLMALLWAVHPALSPSLLSVTVLLTSAYFFIALSAFLYAQFYLRRSKLALWGSCLAYLCAALSYDLLMIAPALVVLFVFFCARDAWRSIIPFAITGIGYLVLRVSAMGAFPSSSQGLLTLSLHGVIDNIVQTTKPFWGIQNAPTWVALVIVFFFVSLCLYHAWRYPSHRWTMLWLILSFGVGSWGIIIGNSSSRYFCMGLPFFVMLVHMILRGIFSVNLTRIILAVFVLMGGARTYLNHYYREIYTSERDTALQQLVADYPTKNYFVLSALHFCNNEIFLLSSGVMQGIQLVGNRPDARVYHLIQIPLCTKTFPSQGKIEVTAVPQGYRIRSTQPEDLWFMVSHGVERMKISMGELIFHKKHSSWQATDVEIILNPEYCTKAWLDETTVVIWNPQIWRFEKVQTDHLSEDA